MAICMLTLLFIPIFCDASMLSFPIQFRFNLRAIIPVFCCSNTHYRMFAYGYGEKDNTGIDL